MLKRILLSAARKIVKWRGTRLADKIETTVDEFHRCIDNVNFEIQQNGEYRVMKIISTYQPALILDVGANNGDWCRMMTTLAPSAQIHCFEPVPATFKELEANTADLKMVRLNPFGLSDVKGTFSIHLGEDSLTASTCKIEGLAYHAQHYFKSEEVDFIRGAEYVETNKMDGIDYLKIDVEGMDLKAIKGFDELIHRIKVIQFEYGIFNIGSRDLLIDFYKYLEPKGFLIGKIFPNRVVFRPYDFVHENFHGSNYLAVNKKEESLISALSKE